MLPAWQRRRPDPAPDALPRVEFKKGEVYFVDAAAMMWHVYDRRLEPGVRITLSCGAGGANTRVFVPQSGPSRSYKFTVGELRDVKVEHLERQLEHAKPSRS
ncbi:MAG: hypothetical protein JWO05_1132 [Gemmatimonadetes bacterium]|nr:hypothetical protein [Gemmatimonadota bacterium]